MEICVETEGLMMLEDCIKNFTADELVEDAKCDE
jgi:hypothetical protein